MPSARLIDYLGVGPLYNRPATPDLYPDTVGVWFDTGSRRLSAWDGFTWEDVGSGEVGSPVAIQWPVGDESTALTAGVGKLTFRAPFPFVISEVRASVKTAPTGATLLAVDLNKSGVSIFSTPLTFDAGEKTTTTATTPAVISSDTVADDEELSVDIDAIGSTIAGAGLKITILGIRA